MGSQADELLNAAMAEGAELGGAIVGSMRLGVDAYGDDSNNGEEGHIVVGADRFITVPQKLKRLGVQYDNNVETVTFDCPRYWDEHDMSTMKVYINYIRADKKVGSYSVDGGVTVDEVDNSIMHFDWTIRREVTEEKGNIIFLVCVKDVDEDGNEQEHWNSELCKDCYISEGLEVLTSIINQYPDVITHLLTRMDLVEDKTTLESMLGYLDTYFKEDSDINEVLKNYVKEYLQTDDEVAKKIEDTVNAYITEHLSATDKTLTKSDMPADAAATGDAIRNAIHEVAIEDEELFTLDDCVAGGLKVVEAFGKSVQEKTSGNQLAEKVSVSQSSNNLNRYSPVLWIEADLKPETTYTISFEGTVGNSLYINENITAYKQFKVVSGITTLTFTTVSNMNKANTNKYDSSNGWIIFKNDAAQTTANVFNNVMLVEGSDALPWEPYTGGVAAPNPEYPQPIVSAGQKLVLGKNLWNSDLELNFTATDTYHQVNLSGWKFVAGTMKILGSVCGFTSSRMVLWVYDSSGNLVINNALPCTITLSQTQVDSITRVSVAIEGVTSGVTYTGKLEIMATTDTEATEYEPYTGGVKAAYDVGISKRITGANLLNLPDKESTVKNGITWSCKNGAVTAKGTATVTSSTKSIDINYDIPIVAGTYIVSGSGTIAKVYVTVTESDGTTVSYNSGQTFTLDGTESACLIFCQVNSGLTANETIYPMLNIGTEALPYEPYTEQNLTLNRVLHGFKTTVSSIATYTDENGQMWCADYIDVKRGVLVQKCKYTVIPLSSFRKTVKTNTVNYQMSLSAKYVGIGGTNQSRYAYCSICNRYLYDTADSVHWYADQSISIFVDKQYESVVDAMESVTVCYPLATPIETPLTTDEIVAMHQLKTVNGVTRIVGSNDPAPRMVVEYGVTDVAGLSLENSNLITVNEALVKEINAAMPYTVVIDDDAGTINFIDRT